MDMEHGLRGEEEDSGGLRKDCAFVVNNSAVFEIIASSPAKIARSGKRLRSRRLDSAVLKE